MHPLWVVPLAGAILGVNLFLFPYFQRTFAPGVAVRPLDLQFIYTPDEVSG